MKIHIFNPENDMALANGTPGYTPPINIRTYRKQHWEFPKLWAKGDDVIWDGESSLGSFFSKGRDFPEISPWGWSPALVHELMLAGVPRSYMPDDEMLLQLRTLSSRVSTVPLQQSLGIDARICYTVEDVEQCMESWHQVIMKSPWSSSGKGLMQTDNANWREWVCRILRLQGSVVVERLVSKKQDFAMEFWLDDNGVRYVGTNIFSTDAHGHYLSNLNDIPLNAEDYISLMLHSPEVLLETRDFFMQHLKRMASWYRGPVGVDMLITTCSTLHPCVEINWRMTMGMVSFLASKDFEW